jgi:NAD-dependent SIR2 family protein deacetylase
MWCGCFCCLQTYAAEEVIDWIDDGETPVCPFCGMPTVLLGETDLATLWYMRRRRFGNTPPPFVGERMISLADPPEGDDAG